MQRKVLESLAARGSFVGLMLPGFSAVPFRAIASFASSLAGTASPLIIDLGIGRFPFSSPMSTETLFLSPLSSVELGNFIGIDVDGTWVITSLGKSLTVKDDGIRQFISNLRLLQKTHPFIVLLFPERWNNTLIKIFRSCGLLLVLSADEADSDSVASELESLETLPAHTLWWAAPEPDKKRFPQLTRSIASVAKMNLPDYRTFQENPELFAQTVKSLLKIRILSQNPLEGFPLFFQRIWLFLCIVFCVIPFVVSTKVDTGLSMLREMRQERDRYSGAPYFDFEFDGTETLQRISRYAIGRFSATVTTDSLVSKYVREVLRKNGLSGNGWRQGDFIYPPKSTRIRFLPPDNIRNTHYDSIAPAWKYFTGMISDSIAYLTELYHEHASATQRMHTGIDVASRMGARIIAPFAAKAWTLKDERGGVVIGLVHDKSVMLFMHCDQLLYLDGQDVMQGDPVATVGITGHTTGPHVHLATGIVDAKGPKSIGNVRYRIVNPITWFYWQSEK